MSSPPAQESSVPRDFRDDNEPGSKRFGYTEEDLQTSKSIFFGHLPGNMTEDELRNDMLGSFTIESVKMGVPKKGPEGTKYAFVAFNSREDAKEAFEKFHGQAWREFPLKIDWDIGQDRKQEINRRVGYGQHRDRGPRGHSRGYGRRERGGYSSRAGSRRPSYGYRSSRYAPYGGGYGDYDRPPRYDSYRSGGYRDYEGKYTPPPQDYYGGSSGSGGYHDRYESSYHRDDHRHHDRYAHGPSDVVPHHTSDYDRYPSDSYGGSGGGHAQDSYGRHSPPPHRGGGGSSYRDAGYQSRDYGHESHGGSGRDAYAHQDSARDYPAESSGYDYPARDQEASYGDRA